MLDSKIRPKLEKNIGKFGIDVEAHRKTLNEFNEPVNSDIVSNFKALYSEANQLISQTTTTGGIIKKDKTPKLVALIDRSTSILLEGDTLIIKGVKFEIISISDANMLGIYYDITLRKC